MALDESTIRRIMREERENERRESEREAKEKARDDKIAELEAKLNAKKPDHEAEPDGDDHPFVS